MSEAPPRPAAAIYLRHYLSPSETFVYRQLCGVSDAFAPIVLTANPYNLDRFPTEPLYVARKGFAGKVYARLARMVTGRYTSLTPVQTRVYRDAIRRHNVRIIHSHFAHFALDLLPLARAERVPMLVTFHGFDASIMLRNRHYLSDLKGLMEYASVIMVSHNMVERLARAGVRARRLHVHYIGVPIEDFVYVERRPVAQKIENGEKLRFLQVSNFVEVKGHRYTVEAFARFAAKYPGSRLTFAGDGPLRAKIELQCRDLGVADQVRFTGTVDQKEVIRLMGESDVFLQHSVTLDNGIKEGLPTVLMEAMASGLVVIATRHSGIPELIEHGVDGLLVAERDVDGYTDALQSLRELDPDVGRRARAKIETSFNMTVQNRRLVDIYRQTIDDHPV
jgi:colanic acid/amylovoran biosynthesis glycosyltransferase